jgi:hypothetical protein
MSRRRSTLMAKYCKARGVSVGWSNSTRTHVARTKLKAHPLCECPQCGCSVRVSRLKRHLGLCKQRKGKRVAKKKGKSVSMVTVQRKPTAKALPLGECPQCGCSVRVSHLELHIGLCKQSKVRITQPEPPPKSTPTAEVMLLPAQVAAGATLKLLLKQDNIRRFLVRRDLKEFRRRLSHLPFSCGVEYQEICGLFEGWHIRIDKLLAQFLTARQFPTSDLLRGDVIRGFRDYVHAFAVESRLEQLPLRPDVQILSLAERLKLVSEVESLRQITRPTC